MAIVFHKLHITVNAVGISNDLLYLQKVFKRYTLQRILCASVWHCFGYP